MDIKVDRTQTPEGKLVFTITVGEPDIAPFEEVEKNVLESIDKFTKEMANTIDSSKELYMDIVIANHRVKEKVFMKVLDNMKFEIENELRPKFKPICQEIYNWIFDHQKGYLKKWMTEFDPQRTTYFFDNDGRFQNQNLNEIAEEKIDEDEDEDDDEY
jgi:hypothetical protein